MAQSPDPLSRRAAPSSTGKLVRRITVVHPRSIRQGEADIVYVLRLRDFRSDLTASVSSYERAWVLTPDTHAICLAWNLYRLTSQHHCFRVLFSRLSGDGAGTVSLSSYIIGVGLQNWHKGPVGHQLHWPWRTMSHYPPYKPNPLHRRVRIWRR